MKNEDYHTKRRPGDNIVFWTKDDKQIFCKDLKGLCKYANEHLEDYSNYPYASTAEYTSDKPIVFTWEPIYIISERPGIKSKYRNECYLIRNENGTLSLPTPEELEHIFDFIEWKRELAYWDNYGNIF